MATAATPVKPLPASVERIAAIATTVGWELERRERSIVVTSPTGKVQSFAVRGKQDDQYIETKATELGLFEALKAHEAKLDEEALAKADQAYAGQLDEEETSEPGGDESFACPECSGVFDSSQARGAHRYRAHGVTSSRQRRKKTAPLPEGVAAAMRLLAEEVAQEMGLGELEDLRQRCERQAALILELGKKTQGGMSAARAERARLEIADLKKRVRDLERFKTGVERAVMTQQPVHAIVRIVELGGHGFGIAK